MNASPPPPRMGPRDPLPALLAAAALGLAVAAAWAWRAPTLAWGYTPDEVGTVTVGLSAWGILTEDESGINPPLLRLLNLFGTPWDTPALGRQLSMTASLAAVPLAFLAGRGAAGRDRAASWLAGLVAAALLASHPWTIRYAGLFRAYAPLSATLLALLAAIGWAEGSQGRTRRVAVACACACAAVAPWWHYLAVPVLFGMGLVGLGAWRRARWLVLPPLVAGLSILPMAPRILAGSSRRVAPMEPLTETVLKLASLGLPPPDWYVRTVGRAYFLATGAYPPQGEVAVGALLVVVVVALLGWGRLTWTARMAVAGLVALGVAVLVVGRVQYVRPATVVIVVTLVAPVLAGLARLTAWRPLSAAVLALQIAWLGPALHARHARDAASADWGLAVPEIVARSRAWDGVRGGRPIYVHPSHGLYTLWFHLARQHPRNAPKGPGCAGYNPCFTRDGVTWAGVDPVGDGSTVRAVVVSTDMHRPETFAAACTPLDAGHGWAAWACGDGPRALGDGAGADRAPRQEARSP